MKRLWWVYRGERTYLDMETPYTPSTEGRERKRSKSWEIEREGKWAGETQNQIEERKVRQGDPLNNREGATKAKFEEQEEGKGVDQTKKQINNRSERMESK